ncbi:MAG: DUF4446 family protein [Patescibacteria group bacterium]
MSTQSILFLVLGIWLGILTIVFFLFALFFRRLTKGVAAGDLKKILEGILLKELKNAEGVEKLNRQVDALTQEGFGHVQKVGMVRFNPFKEIGGDHSFSLAILDGRDTGIVITGLHTRERTRIYAKVIKEGKSEFELSDEEKKALASAHKR